MNTNQILLSLAGLVLILGGAYFVFTTSNVDEIPEEGNGLITYTNPELGVEFQYKTGPEGYVVEEKNIPDETSGLIASVVLTRTEDSLRGAPQGGEGPPTITLSVFSNRLSQSPQVWADTHGAYSNIALKMGEVAEDRVGGSPAIRYMADGLYQSENVVVASGDHVFMFTGMYLDAASELRADFAPLVETVNFSIPVPGDAPQGKLDIRAVCESALAYMTFENGEAAETFVDECIEGKHPEVIERYKKDNGLDGAVI